MVPGGIPRFLGSTASFRSSRKVLAGGLQSFTLRLQAVRTPLLHFARSADDVGRIRRCQRSTCVAAALPAPRRGKEINMRGNHPSISWNDSTNGGGASMAATAKAG